MPFGWSLKSSTYQRIKWHKNNNNSAIDAVATKKNGNKQRSIFLTNLKPKMIGQRFGNFQFSATAAKDSYNFFLRIDAQNALIMYKAHDETIGEIDCRCRCRCLLLLLLWLWLLLFSYSHSENVRWYPISFTSMLITYSLPLFIFIFLSTARKLWIHLSMSCYQRIRPTR